MSAQLNFSVDYDTQEDRIYLTRDGVFEDEFPLTKTNPVEQLIRTELENIGVINPYGKQITHPLTFGTRDRVQLGETSDGDAVSIPLMDRHVTILGRGGSGRDNLLRSFLLHVAAFPNKLQAVGANFKDSSMLNTAPYADNIESAATTPLDSLDALLYTKWILDFRKRRGLSDLTGEKTVLLFVHEPDQLMSYGEEYAESLKALREEGPDVSIFIISSVAKAPEGSFLSAEENDIIITVGNVNDHDREVVFEDEADYVSNSNPIGVSWFKSSCYNSEGEPINEFGEVVDFGEEYRQLVRFYNYIVPKSAWEAS